MQRHPEERLVLERLQALVEAHFGSVSGLEDLLGEGRGTLDSLRPAPPGTPPLSIGLFYRVLDALAVAPRDFFCQVYGLRPSEGEVSSGISENFPPFERVLETVRLLVHQSRKGEKGGQ